MFQQHTRGQRPQNQGARHPSRMMRDTPILGLGSTTIFERLKTSPEKEFVHGFGCSIETELKDETATRVYWNIRRQGHPSR